MMSWARCACLCLTQEKDSHWPILRHADKNKSGRPNKVLMGIKVHVIYK